MSLAPNSYQAEILRHIHETYGGHLQDTDIGVTRRLWNELGQQAGCHFASVAAALSTLENDGRLITEFGLRSQGGRCRVSVLVMEEPPEGVTVWKGRVVHKPVEPIVSDDAKPPTAEEIATWLLRKTVEASQVPVLDIVAAQHHVECLNEDLSAWQELATEYEERIGELRAQLHDAEQQRSIQVELYHEASVDHVCSTMDADALRRELAQVTRWRDDARRDLARVRQLLHQTQERVGELQDENQALQARASSGLSETEAQQLQARVRGLEETLEESRRANDKATRKIERQAQELNEAAGALTIARQTMRQAEEELTTTRERNKRVETNHRIKTEQLAMISDRLIEKQFDVEILSAEDREFVDALIASLHELVMMDRKPNEGEIHAILQRHNLGDAARAAGREASIIDFESSKAAVVEIHL